MRLLVSTGNINCYLALYQSCKRYNIECLKFDIVPSEYVKTDDVVIYLESIIKLYKDLKCVVINRRYFDRELMDKYSQFIEIQKAGLNYIPTYTRNELLITDISIPFVTKPRRGSMGDNVRLLYFKENLNSADIFQPFIKNEGDWRIIVINNKAISMIKRHGPIFLNNIAKGALAWTEWDQTAAELAEQCAKALGAEYCGVDIMKCSDTGKYYFLESNITPTFDTSQILTRIDIADEIVKYIKNTYN